MSNYNPFIEKSPSAIVTFNTKNNKISYEVILISYIENDQYKHRQLINCFFNACNITKSNKHILHVATESNILKIWSGKKPSGMITASNKNMTLEYKLILTSHTENDDELWSQQETLGGINYIISNCIK